MNTDKADSQSADDRLGVVLAACLEAIDRGETDPQFFIARYPEFAVELKELFAGQARLEQIASPLRQAVQAGKAASQMDATTGPSNPLGDFRIQREVGRGGMGIVYEAEQLSLGRRVALKVLPFAATIDHRHLQRFQNEARAAASLEHPHIVPVYGVGCERGIHYYAMKFIDGQTLSRLIKERAESTGEMRQPLCTLSPEDVSRRKDDATCSPESPTTRIAAARTESTLGDSAGFRQIAEWGIQAALALEHAHSFGIVHRDIKPANLIIDGLGELWVTDFGLARTTTDAGLTMTGDVLGTLRYMSPEQALAKHGLVDHRTDVYSLGVTLYELLSGEPAVEGTDRNEILNAITRDEPRPLRTFNAAIPRDLETIVLKAMAKDTFARYATAKEVADDLRHFLLQEPIRAKRANLVTRAKKWSQRHKTAVAAATCVLALGMIGMAIGSYLLWQKEAETRAALGQAEEQRITASKNEAKADALRHRAEIDFNEILNAMGDSLRLLDKKELAEIPGIRKVRQELGAYIVRYHQSYLDEQSSDPDVRNRTARTYQSIGKLYSLQGETEKARQALVNSVALAESLTRDYPDETRYWTRLGHNRHYWAEWLTEQGLDPHAAEEYRRGVDAFEMAARLAPDDAPVLNNLAWHFATSSVPTIHNPARAIVLAQRAVELSPEKGNYWNTLGVACYRAGSWNEAVTALERGLALELQRTTFSNENVWTWFYLAMAHSRLRQDQQARSCYEKAGKWMAKNAPQDESLRRLHTEAAEVLRIQQAIVSTDKP